MVTAGARTRTVDPLSATLVTGLPARRVST